MTQISNSPFKDKDVLVHIDFKGAPPKMDLVIDFIRWIHVASNCSMITGFVFEFEDMLPFTGEL